MKLKSAKAIALLLITLFSISQTGCSTAINGVGGGVAGGLVGGIFGAVVVVKAKADSDNNIDNETAGYAILTSVIVGAILFSIVSIQDSWFVEDNKSIFKLFQYKENSNAMVQKKRLIDTPPITWSAEK